MTNSGTNITISGTLRTTPLSHNRRPKRTFELCPVVGDHHPPLVHKLRRHRGAFVRLRRKNGELPPPPPVGDREQEAEPRETTMKQAWRKRGGGDLPLRRLGRRRRAGEGERGGRAPDPAAYPVQLSRRNAGVNWALDSVRGPFFCPKDLFVALQRKVRRATGPVC